MVPMVALVSSLCGRKAKYTRKPTWCLSYQPLEHFSCMYKPGAQRWEASVHFYCSCQT